MGSFSHRCARCVAHRQCLSSDSCMLAPPEEVPGAPLTFSHVTTSSLGMCSLAFLFLSPAPDEVVHGSSDAFHHGPGFVSHQPGEPGLQTKQLRFGLYL